ncbi:MAG: hypothetical protein ACKVZ6_03290 [Kineosporiaceae bacterium]
MAWAAAGTYTQTTSEIIFFYDVSSGNADSYDFSGYGTARLRADAPGATDTHTFGAYYFRNRTLQPDDQLKYSGQLAYSRSEYVSSTFTTSSSSKYHTYAGWSWSGNEAGVPSGYSRKG